MSNSSNTLFYFVESFSSEKAEQFFEKELPYLSASFKQILLFVLYKDVPNSTQLPNNVSIANFDLYQPYNRIGFLRKNWNTIFKLYVANFFITRHKLNYFFQPFRHITLLMNRLNDADNLHQYIQSKFNYNNAVFYSYWFNHWVSVLSLVKYKYQSNIKIYTRIHGSDYQEGQKTEGYFPFRAIELQNVYKVLSVSQYGIDYIKKEYPTFKNLPLLDLAYLGTNDYGLNPLENKEVFHIVSCSSVIELKRVHLIAEILKHIDFPVKWTHFGDGNLLNELKKQVQTLPSNIKVSLKEYVPNHQVIDFYKKETVHLFINVSEYEGIPVSLMEAISFGIPVMATNICGNPEIANAHTGFSIEKDFNPINVATLITKNKTQLMTETSLRQNAKQFWLEHFYTDKNYKKLAEYTLV